MPKLVLTKLGELANEFGAITPPDFWRSLYLDAERCADADGDVDLLFSERIAGIEAMRDRFYEILSDSDGRADDAGGAPK